MKVYINKNKISSRTYDALNDASLIELKVLSAISLFASDDGSFDEASVASAIELPLEDIKSAVTFWRGVGILKLTAPKNNSQPKTTSVQDSALPKKAVRKTGSPDYTGDELTAIFKKNEDISKLIDECQKLAGKVFNPHETGKIVGMNDYLGLSPEFILTVFAYCAKKGKTVVHYVEKTAYNLYDEGIDNIEKLEEYLRKKELFESASGKIRTMFGMGTRAFTEKEKNIITLWTETWKISDELLKEAFEITVNATGKPSISYAAKIIENWHEKGYKTVSDTKKDNIDKEKNKKTDKEGSFQFSSFDTDEFFQAALRKSYESISEKGE